MILAGTGHRPDKLGGYDPYTKKRVLDFAQRTLEYYKPELVLSGMAQGWDMALAQKAYELKIPFRAYVPFMGQELVWPTNTRLYYKVLLERAQQVIICSEGGYTKAAMQVRNQRMIDDCDFLAALWNGTTGGTANAVGYAIYIDKPFYNLWPLFESNGDFDEPESDDSLPYFVPDPDWLDV